MGHATLERVRLFGTRSADYIRASGHSGCIATEVVLQAKQAEYMTAPERFAEMPDFSLAPRAPSIHDPYRKWSVHRSTHVAPVKAESSPSAIAHASAIHRAVLIYVIALRD